MPQCFQWHVWHIALDWAQNSKSTRSLTVCQSVSETIICNTVQWGNGNPWISLTCLQNTPCRTQHITAQWGMTSNTSLRRCNCNVPSLNIPNRKNTKCCLKKKKQPAKWGGSESIWLLINRPKYYNSLLNQDAFMTYALTMAQLPAGWVTAMPWSFHPHGTPSLTPVPTHTRSQTDPGLCVD